MRTTHFLALLASTVLLSGVMCNAPLPLDQDYVSLSLGSEGGVVEITDPASRIYGTRLEVAEGALTNNCTFTLSAADAPTTLPLWLAPAGPAVDVDFEDMMLDSPGLLSLPYDDKDNDGFIDGTSISELDVSFAVLDDGENEWKNESYVSINAESNLAQILVKWRRRVVLTMPVPTSGPSIRIMTYNTALTQVPMPQFDGTHPVTGVQISDSERAVWIAEGVRRVDPDIVAFNEVFDEEARPVLVQKLKNRYPHYVEYLDSSWGCTFPCVDSGLMLFSKWPFIPLSDHTYSAGDCVAYNNGTEWCDEVAFADFAEMSGGPDCEGYDCAANKGAGIVRIQNPNNGQRFTVVFAHLQASYGKGDDDPADALVQVNARREQLEYIRDVLKTTLTWDELTTELIFMVGDLNINGNQLSQYDQWSEMWYEWYHRFDDDYYMDYANRGFYACGLNPCPDPNAMSVFADGWAYETSPDDLGRTQGCNLLFFNEPPEQRARGERLDYILHSNPNKTRTGVCASHLSIAWGVGANDGKHQFSDHLPILGEFTRYAPLGDAVSARTVPLSSPGATDSYDGVIKYPGAMQWHIIAKPGAYAIGAYAGNPNRVGFDVYESHDLSRPCKAYPGEPAAHYGPKYTMPNPPYYIRIYGQKWNGDTAVPDRTWTGDYDLIVHKLDCASPNESCPLDPAVEEQPYPWPSAPVNADDTLWYSFMTENGEQYDYPTLKFYLTLPSPLPVTSYNAANYYFDIADTAAGNPPLVPSPITLRGASSDGMQIYVHAEQLKPDGSKPKEYLLKLKRKQPLGATHTKLRYTTNLTYFYPHLFKCDIQNDDFGDDDTFYIINVDSGTGEAYTCVDPSDGCTWYWSYLAEFDGGTAFAPQEKFGHVRKYVNWIHIDLMEWDGGTPNDYLWPHPSHSSRIGPLAEDQAKAEGLAYTWSDESEYDDADYWYVLHYSLTHKPQ